MTKPKVIQTKVNEPKSLKDAMDKAMSKWYNNWVVVHGPAAYWHYNLFTDKMDAIVIASVKSRKRSQT